MAGRVAIQDQGFSAVVLVRTDKQAVTTSIVWSDAIFRQPSRDADENVVILILSYGGNAELVSPPGEYPPQPRSGLPYCSLSAKSLLFPSWPSPSIHHHYVRLF
jgi:hypothetical protein